MGPHMSVVQKSPGPHVAGPGVARPTYRWSASPGVAGPGIVRPSNISAVPDSLRECTNLSSTRKPFYKRWSKIIGSKCSKSPTLKPSTEDKLVHTGSTTIQDSRNVQTHGRDKVPITHSDTITGCQKGKNDALYNTPVLELKRTQIQLEEVTQELMDLKEVTYTIRQQLFHSESHLWIEQQRRIQLIKQLQNRYDTIEALETEKELFRNCHFQYQDLRLKYMYDIFDDNKQAETSQEGSSISQYFDQVYHNFWFEAITIGNMTELPELEQEHQTTAMEKVIGSAEHEDLKQRLQESEKTFKKLREQLQQFNAETKAVQTNNRLIKDQLLNILVQVGECREEIQEGQENIRLELEKQETTRLRQQSLADSLETKRIEEFLTNVIGQEYIVRNAEFESDDDRNSHNKSIMKVLMLQYMQEVQMVTDQLCHLDRWRYWRPRFKNTSTTKKNRVLGD